MILDKEKGGDNPLLHVRELQEGAGRERLLKMRYHYYLIEQHTTRFQKSFI